MDWSATGIKPGEVVAIFLANSWEFCAAFHAAMLAGAIPTLLNPTCRERELRYQLENSGAVLLITDGGNIEGINLGELPHLRRVYTTRQPASGCEPFVSLLHPVTAVQHKPDQSSEQILAALPYSSGTTGLPKGVMLSHYNLVANVYQYLAPMRHPNQWHRHHFVLPSPLSHLRSECDPQSHADSGREACSDAALQCGDSIEAPHRRSGDDDAAGPTCNQCALSGG